MSPARASRERPGLRMILAQILPAALLSLLFAAVGVVHVTSRVRVVHAGYALSQLENEGRTLTRENDLLKLERNRLRSSANLEPFARERLGMVPPAPNSVFAVGPNRPASPAAPRRTERPDSTPTAVRVARGTP